MQESNFMNLDPVAPNLVDNLGINMRGDTDAENTDRNNHNSILDDSDEGYGRQDGVSHTNKYNSRDNRGGGDGGRYNNGTGNVVRTHPRFLARVDKGNWIDRDCTDSTAIRRMMIDKENMRLACSWESHPANIFLFENVPNFIIDRALEDKHDENYNEHSAGRLVSNVKMLRRFVRIGRFPDPTQTELDDGHWIDRDVEQSVAISRMMVDDANQRLALSWSSSPDNIYIYAGIPQYIVDLVLNSDEMMGKIVKEVKKLKRYSTIPRFPQASGNTIPS